MTTKVRTNRKQDAWCKTVESLLADIETWAQEERWLVDRHEKTITKDLSGPYELPELTIRVPGGNIIVEPIGKDIVGSDGLVDISSWPNMSRMILTLKGNVWRIKTDSGVRWPKPWNKDTFVELAKLLVSQE